MKNVSLHAQYAAKPHVLVVDDDRRIRDLLLRFLSEQGFVAMAADGAAQAADMMRFFQFDVLVVDVMMPGEDGLSFTKNLRRRSAMPVLLLTAQGETQDRINGFEAGADDYLPKPFEPKELLLRLHAILRRAAIPQEGLKPFKIGPWHFDPATGDLTDQARRLRLTESETALLKALGAQAGHIVSREDLARKLGLNASERTIDVQVTRLRRKLESDPKAPRYLQTVRGKGYRLRLGHED